MSNKFGKLLLGGAAVAAAVTGAAYLFMKKKEQETSWEDDLEDFEDGLGESEEPAGGASQAVSREYVTLHMEHSPEAEPAGAEDEATENASADGEPAADASDDAEQAEAPAPEEAENSEEA